MGGDYEKLIETRTAKGSSIAKELAFLAGKGRIHEDKGQVHIHDDTNKLKVAVPSYVFESRFKDWRSVPSPSTPLIFLDTTNGTMATLKWMEEAGTPLKFNVEILLQKVEIGSNLQSLIEHSEAR